MSPNRQVLPEEVRSLTGRYLHLVAEALPGRFEGLYLIGSLALGDYQPGRSDIDFIATTPTQLNNDELQALETLHAVLQQELPRPWFSGVYITPQDLGRNPTELKAVPFYHEGDFSRSGGFDANPSTWLTLRNYPLAIHGPIPEVWHDPAVIRRWNRENLNSYWSGLVTQLIGAIDRITDESIPAILAWCVPGVTRLYFTIVTGDVTSKSGACRYGLSTFPSRWHPLLQDALAARMGGTIPPSAPRGRAEETIAFMRFVIESANRAK